MEGFECYEYKADESSHNYYFLSIGPRGQIIKRVRFTSFVENSYNISLGDYDPKSGQINYQIVSDNGDMNKVFITVTKIIYEFTLRYPNARIYFAGSTASRTRLYQMTINRYKRLIETVFYVHGCNGDEEEAFISDKTYDSFIVFRK